MNCSCPGKPPDIKEIFKEARLPWEIGTAQPPVVPTLETTTLTSTLVMIPGNMFVVFLVDPLIIARCLPPQFILESSSLHVATPDLR